MGSQNKSTQQSTSEPWKPAQPMLQNNLNLASNMQKAGIGGAVNTASNVTPFAQQTTDAMGSAESLARANMGGQGLSGQYQNVINSGGFNSPQMDAVQGMRSTATGSFNPYDNAGFGSVLRQAQDSAANAVNASASMAGRYGGGSHQGMLAKSVGEVTGGLLNNEWNNFNARRDAAQSNLFNAGQQGLGNIGAAFQGMQAPLDTLGKVGGAYEDLFTRQINDRNRIFDSLNNAPLNSLMNYNAIYAGNGALGGTTSGTATSPGANPFATGAGGLLALSGLL